MDEVAIVVLAAGLGKRMGLGSPKVLALTDSGTLIEHLLKGLEDLPAARLVVVTGFGHEQVEENIKNSKRLSQTLKDKVSFVFQPEQKGTGDAVRCSLPALASFKGTVLVMPGDTPLIRSESLKDLIKQHESGKATISLLTFTTPESNAYGRVIRDKSKGQVLRIVEAKDCSAEELSCQEYNSSMYAVDSAFLPGALQNIGQKNAQGEFYFTDVVKIAVDEGQTVQAVFAHDCREFLGVNTLLELNRINRLIAQRRIEKLILEGACISNPDSTYIGPDVKISPQVRIGPDVQIRGKSEIASGVIFEGSAYLLDTIVEENAVIRFSVRSEQAKIGKGAAIGPFAHLRKGTVLEEDTRIGNFVEVKNSHISKGTKASHLTYLGDTRIGQNTNVGAGTITCNYDGLNKNPTMIGDNVFIGSNTCLVAPVTIEDNVLIGAGSVITKNVEKGALALTRPPLLVKPGRGVKK